MNVTALLHSYRLKIKLYYKFQFESIWAFKYNYLHIYLCYLSEANLDLLISGSIYFFILFLIFASKSSKNV